MPRSTSRSTSRSPWSTSSGSRRGRERRRPGPQRRGGAGGARGGGDEYDDDTPGRGPRKHLHTPASVAEPPASSLAAPGRPAPSGSATDRSADQRQGARPVEPL